MCKHLNGFIIKWATLVFKAWPYVLTLDKNNQNSEGLHQLND